MIAEARDFEAESGALHALLDPLPEADLSRVTLFKGWTLNDILQHLHVWNHAAALSVRDEAALVDFIARMKRTEGGLRAFEDAFLQGLSGRRLLDAWAKGAKETAELFSDLDPKQRLQWVGPSMSARSSITARQMETWAHGQAAYDLLGAERRDTDAIRSIAHLGVATFGWTYAVRGRKPPGPVPYVNLTAPSGETWEWGEPGEDAVRGSATEFCQVVAQTRNIADTALAVTGEAASDWMSIAQCFAGEARTPPPPGTRRRQA